MEIPGSEGNVPLLIQKAPFPCHNKDHKEPGFCPALLNDYWNACSTP